MNQSSKEELDIALLVIVALTILAGLCVLLIASLPENFFPTLNWGLQ